MNIKDKIWVLRSKNAGPFAITFDVVFKDPENYEKAKTTLNEAMICEAFQIPAKDFLSFDSFDDLSAIKVSIRRRQTSGHPGDSDCYSMNQEEPFAWLLETVVA